MIDIHSHLLPGVDDGVATREESLALIEEYRQAGFSHIVCTPHLHDPYVTTKIHLIREAFAWFRDSAREAGITALLGSELYMSPNPGKFIPFLDRFLLIETNTEVEPLYLLDEVFKLQMQGLTIILAHIERYAWFSAENYIAQRLREMGVLFQVNAQMLTNPEVVKYLDMGWVDFIASDNHGKRRGNIDYSRWARFKEENDRSKLLLGLD